MTDETHVELVDAPAPAPAKKARKQDDGVKRVKIILEEHDSIPPTGQYVGVNGVGYLLKPGEPIDVPEHVVHVLDNAIQSKPIMDGVRIVGYRDGLRLPYRRLS